MATTQTATRPLLDLHKGYRSTSALADRGLHKTNADLDEARHRPSQQDLEIARQLQSFHSQTNSSKHDEDARHDAEPRSAEMDTDDHELTTQQRAESPTASDRSERYLPSPNPTVTGQVCTNCGTTKTPLWRRSPTGAVICNACGLYYKARNQMRPVGLKRTAAAMSPNTSAPTGRESQQRSTSPAPMHCGANYVSTNQIADGTCPGGGRCNSQGGQLICQGCPSFNNRIAKAAQVALRQANDRPGDETGTPSQHHADQPQTVVVACQNCGTTVTPLWRRDEAGNAICNACGLYHKLHGHHRPVQMKKAEIKRRKRVVPAHMNSGGAAPGHADQLSDRALSHDPISTSPLPQERRITVLEPRTGPSAIPVDFTDAFRQNTPQHAYNDPQHIPSKRSYSSTTMATTPAENAPTQPVGFSAINAIDPSLPLREDGLPVGKEARRAELRREAEQMRQLLEEKERELAALADD